MRFRMIKFEGRDLLLDRDPGAPRPALAVEPDPSRAGAQACHRADWARRDEKSRGRGRRGWEVESGEESARSGREGLATYKRGPGNAYSLSSVSFTVSFNKKYYFSTIFSIFHVLHMKYLH